METPDKTGYTKDGEVARDYLEAGRSPELPRYTLQELEEVVIGREYFAAFKRGADSQ